MTSPASFEKLFANFSTLYIDARMVLNEKLEPVPGSFAHCPHNDRLSSLLQRLEAVRPEEIVKSDLLALFRFGVNGYVEKVARSAKIARKISGRTPTTIDTKLVEKILGRLATLEAAVSSKPHAQEKQSPVPLSLEEIIAIGPHRFTTGMVTDWEIIRAIDGVATMVQEADALRSTLLSHNYGLVRGGHGIHLCPPPSHYDAPWPILILEAKIGKLIDGKPLHTSEQFRKIISQITKARTEYPHHSQLIDNLLLYSKLIETTSRADALISECAQSLCAYQKKISQSPISDITQRLTSDLDQLTTRIRNMLRERSEFDTSALSSAEQWLQRGNKLENDEHTIFLSTGEIFAHAASLYRKKLPELASEYTTAYTKLIETEPQRRFSPSSKIKIFSTTSFVFSHISKTLPSPSEFSAFSPLTLPSLFDERPLPPPEKPDTFTLPPQQPPKKPLLKKKKKTLPPLPKREAPDSPQALETSMEALCIAPQPTPPIPFFSFNVGDSFNSNLQYGWRVRRWWNTDTYDPFRDDSHYSLKTFSSSTKKAIRSQHALPLAVTTVLFECGKKFVNADGSQERFFLPAEAHLDDGRYEKGVITLGRIPQSQLIFHYHFSQLAPSTLCRSYAKDGFFQSYDDEDSSCEVEPECVDPRKTLPLDKSEISAISDTKLGTIEVTVSDPERGRTIILFVEKPD